MMETEASQIKATIIVVIIIMMWELAAESVGTLQESLLDVF